MTGLITREKPKGVQLSLWDLELTSIPAKHRLHPKDRQPISPHQSKTWMTKYRSKKAKIKGGSRPPKSYWPPSKEELVELIKSGMPDRIIAELYHTSRKKVRGLRAKHFLAPARQAGWSDEEKKLLLDLSEDTLTLADAARLFCETHERSLKAAEVMLFRLVKGMVPKESTVKKMRVCLGPNCQGKKEFLSEGVGNRLCPNCITATTNLNQGL